MKKMVCKTEHERMEWFHDHCGRRWWHQYVMVTGFQTLLKCYGSSEGLSKGLLRFQKKSVVSRNLKKMRQMLLRTPGVEKDRPNLIDLYQELYAKIIDE